MNDEEKYQRRVKNLNDNLEQAQKNLKEAEEQLKNLDSLEEYNEKQKFYLRYSVLPKQISRNKNLIEDLKKQLEFVRPANKEDGEYRKKFSKDYNEKICTAIPDDLHLLFHGTTIYYAKDIIYAGEISSPGERGVESDITSPGNIWVTSKYSARGINTTLDYAKMGVDDECMPAGCIFVLRTDKENEEKCGKSLLTDSLSFKENPDKLFSIITTPENIKRVKEWCEESKIDTDKVKDYELFLETLKNKEYAKDVDINENEKKETQGIEK